MSIIGSPEEARLICEWVVGDETERWGVPFRAYDKIPPEGWEYVGRGSYRSVWLSPSKVIYKVNHEYGNCNYREYEKLCWIRSEGRIPLGSRLPKAWLYEPRDGEYVVAMEYVPGVILEEYDGDDQKRISYYDLMLTLERRFELYDMHDQNVIVDEEGFLVPIDFGE